MIKRRILLAGAGLAWAALPSWAYDKWPDRPIRLIMPVAAGGSSDVMAR